MTRFSYSAISLDSPAGAAVRGRREAADAQALREALRSEGMIALEVKPVRLADAVRQPPPDSASRR